jgi:hypothetical protein
LGGHASCAGSDVDDGRAGFKHGDQAIDGSAARGT